jgi:tripartite-type tricarboxylate transporter receptor subunit TctC
MKLSQKVWLCLFAASMSALVPGYASAQGWPSKPVRVIVSIGPGSATDTAARIFADIASKSIGQSMVVENLVGAAGAIGAQAAARAAPDGYTIYVAPSSTLASNPYMYKNLPYNAFKDFEAIGMLVDTTPLSIAVNPDLPANSIQELVNVARSQPGKLSYAIDASSGFQIIIGRLLKFRGGIDMVEVPYKVGSQAVQDGVAGRVQVVVSSLAPIGGMVRAGKLRLLAVTSEKRFPGWEQVPAVAETFPGYRVDGWFALMGPAGMPQEAVSRLNRAVSDYVNTPDVGKKLLAFAAAITRHYTPAETAKFIRDEQAYWAKAIKDVNFVPE